MSYEQVSKDIFEVFIKIYPRKLNLHRVNFCTPSVLEWHDFSIGKPNDNPSSKVAYRVDVEGSQGDDGSGDKYYIVYPAPKDAHLTEAE